VIVAITSWFVAPVVEYSIFAVGEALSIRFTVAVAVVVVVSPDNSKSKVQSSVKV
jgi:hypothetical protein